MAREIDLDNLSNEDLVYLSQRPWLLDEAELRGYDDVRERVSEVVESTPEGGVYVDVHEEASGSQEPDEGSAPPNPDPDATDNYDDETAWSYKDLQDEVKKSKEAKGDDYDGPALNAGRAELVAYLRAEDAANADDEDEDDDE